jgi:hypothetical protein
VGTGRACLAALVILIAQSHSDCSGVSRAGISADG